MATESAATSSHGEEMRSNEPLSGWIELTAGSNLDHLRRMQTFSEAVFARHLPPELCDDMRTIIEEVGRNAIEWGNRFDASKRVAISYCLLPDRVVFKFEDEGEGFRPQDVPDPTRDPVAHIKRRAEEGKRPGGYGVFMVQQLMDEVVYSEKGNVVLMTKLIPAVG